MTDLSVLPEDIREWIAGSLNSKDKRIAELEAENEMLRDLAETRFNAGLDRAAEIADDEHLYDKYKHGCTNQDAANAIRKEIEQ